MKCNKCGSVMIQLFSSWVCDACPTPMEQGQEKMKAGGTVSNPCTEISVPIQGKKDFSMLTIGDINFYFSPFLEITVPNYLGVFAFSIAETNEIYKFIQMDITNQGQSLHCTLINLGHVTNIIGERELTFNIPGYISRSLNEVQYKNLLKFMKPFVHP